MVPQTKIRLKRFFTKQLLKGFALGCMLLLLLNSCKKKVNKVAAVNPDALSMEIAHHVILFYSQHAIVKARLTAPLLLRYTKPPASVVLNKGLRVQFFDDSLHVKSVLTAKMGKYLEGKDDILVKDSVVVVNDKGERLECKELHWDSKKQQFFTDKPVKIITSSNIIYGDGLTANQDFTERTIIHPHGEIKVSNNQLP